MGFFWNVARGAMRSIARPLGFDLVRYGAADNHIEAIGAAAGNRAIRTILDVGANIGQTAFEFHRHFPEAIIHSVEPFDEAFVELTRRTREKQRIIPHLAALGAFDGETVMYLNRQSVTNSLLPNADRIDEFSPAGGTDPIGSVKVRVRRLDTRCRETGIEQIDLLKIDTQGYEAQVLGGAGAMLCPATIGLVYLEVAFVPVYQNQSDFQQVHALLTSRGYKLYDLFEKVRDFPQGLRWANALFVPASQ
ncbi:MAG: FkbM family methyltransferase [Gemmatimonadales bacterium]|nr:MAG: FkbM family methyltransferase [Gemmatimonadales bacterium]